MENNALNSIWFQSFEVSWLDADIQGQAKLSTLFNYLQEVALKHADHMGFGFNEVKKNGQLWVVARILLKMERYPSWRDEVTVETWPRGVEGLWAFREYRIKDKVGRILGGASSSWLVLDVKDRKPVSPELVFHALPFVNPESATNEVPKRINTPKEMFLSNPHEVTYSDVDFYQHVNNSKYIDWVLDSLYRLNLQFKVKNFNINYISEAKMGDVILLRYSHKEGKVIFRGEQERNGTTVFLAELD